MEDLTLTKSHSGLSGLPDNPDGTTPSLPAETAFTWFYSACNDSKPIRDFTRCKPRISQPWTHPFVTWETAQSTKGNEIPVALKLEKPEYKEWLPQRRDREQIPVTRTTPAPRPSRRTCLNEGTGNKSRSLNAEHLVMEQVILASTKGPGTNPGHGPDGAAERGRQRASTKGPGTNPGHVATPLPPSEW